VRSGSPPATPRGRRWLTPLPAAIGMRLLVQSTASAQSDYHYRAEDVQNGYTLHQSRCQLCHGPNGDIIIGGVNLARQRFHQAVSDDDVHATILHGNQGGMPAFDLSNGQVESLIAHIRTGSDISGGPVGPITYQVDCEQYVAVIAGNVLASFALPDCTRGKPCT
jgi:mono/diheme cytochrome c family protein